MPTRLVLSLALAIQGSNSHIPPATVTLYATQAEHIAKARHLDPWLLEALVERETRWTATAVRHEANGSCSAGLGQINGPCRAGFIQPLLDPRVNLLRTARFLVHLRDGCRTACQALGWLRGYNPGSPGYLEAIREAVKKHHAQDGQPPVHR